MGKARNLARLIVESTGAVSTTALTNVPPSNDASALTTGTLPAARIADGSLAIAKLSATGTPSSSTFLRGDGSWQSASGGVTSLNGQTGAITNTDLNAIGSYSMGRLCNGANMPGASAGTTSAGTAVFLPTSAGDVPNMALYPLVSYSTYYSGYRTGGSFGVGSWRLLVGYPNGISLGNNNTGGRVSLWVRYA